MPPCERTANPTNSMTTMNDLPDQEAQALCGGLGVFESLLVATAVAIISTDVNNWDSFKAGLMGQPDPAAKSSAQ